MVHENFYDLRNFLLILITSGGVLKIIFFMLSIMVNDDKKDEYITKIKHILIFVVSADLVVTAGIPLFSKYFHL